jgi:hypothetical protein
MLQRKAGYRRASFLWQVLCDKFYLPSARVYMQQILYDMFSYDKFYLLVWSNKFTLTIY